MKIAAPAAEPNSHFSEEFSHSCGTDMYGGHGETRNIQDLILDLLSLGNLGIPSSGVTFPQITH